MKTQAELEAYIRKLLVSNNLDINITQYPELIVAGQDLGYDINGLAAVAGRVYESTDWRPYKLIDEHVVNSPSFAQGRFFNEDARPIVERVKEELAPSEAIAYIISIISREPHNFRPRMHPAPDTGSFRDPWMTDDAWERYKRQNEPVEWCNMQAITQEQLGEICFNRKDETQQLLQNKLYLPSTIMLLTRSAARAQSFEKIFDEVKDVELRYLTVIYRLNNELPFRFRGSMYNTLPDLLTEACGTHESFRQLEAVYAKTHIHIWQREAQTSFAGYLPADMGKLGFLELLYKVNPHYPFYLNERAYLSPVQLVSAASANGALWKHVYQAIDDRELHVWFAAQGQAHWNEQLDKQIATIFESGLYNDEDRKLASVQSFINLVDESAPLPAIQPAPQTLSFLQMEASHTITSAVNLRLSTDGFVKATVRLVPEIPGISIDKTIVKFFGLVENRHSDIQLTIDPMQLQKDSRYTFNIVVNSVYEEVRIPVEVSVVFPRKAYITEMLKWGTITTVFFAITGFLGLAIDDRKSYDVATTDYLPLDVSFDHLPGSSFGYLFLLLLLTGGALAAFRYIRQTYKTNAHE